eukprot:726650-Prorocentrum_minimum.AAC.1
MARPSVSLHAKGVKTRAHLTRGTSAEHKEIARPSASLHAKGVNLQGRGVDSQGASADIRVPIREFTCQGGNNL